MNVMNLSLWWLALPVLLLPILWHRQKREQTKAAPLASARFLPVSEPKQLRVWRWSDPLLLLLRCLMLLALIALLADLVLAWRGDSVLVAPGTDASFVKQQALDAGFKDAQQLVLLDHDAMRTGAKPEAGPVERHVAVFSEHADDWRRLFAAARGSWNIVVDAQPGPRTELLVWDRPEPAPATLRAPLWWVTDAHTFPELDQAARVDGMRVTETPRGRVWQIAGWPPREPEAARAVFAAWQRLHLAPQPYTAPAQALSAEPNAPAGPASGALREILATLLVALFVLERMLTHARRR